MLPWLCFTLSRSLHYSTYALLHSTRLYITVDMAELHTTLLYITLPWLILHSTRIYITSTMAVLHTTRLYITLPWLYFILLESTLHLPWLYFTLLDSTLLYQGSIFNLHRIYIHSTMGSTSFYITLPWLFFTLHLHSTMTLLHSTRLHYTTLLHSTRLHINLPSTSLY